MGFRERCMVWLHGPDHTNTFSVGFDPVRVHPALNPAAALSNLRLVNADVSSPSFRIRRSSS
jgi:hypothetical protein